MPRNKAPVGRLAMRVEGNFWNAYYALPDSMEGALLIGSIRFAAVAANSQLKDAFMEMMKGVVTSLIESHDGAGAVSWGNPFRAPEHERAGHG